MSLYEIEGNDTVKITGHLDRDTLSRDWWVMLSSSERSQLQKAGRCNFDLKQVERADSAGLAWIINAVRDARAHDIEVSLHAVPKKVLKLAKISDVDTLLPVK